MNEEILTADWIGIAVLEFAVIFALVVAIIYDRALLKEKDKDYAEMKAERFFKTEKAQEYMKKARKLEERNRRLEWYIINTLARAGVGKLDAATYVERLANGDLDSERGIGNESTGNKADRN